MLICCSTKVYELNWHGRGRGKLGGSYFNNIKIQGLLVQFTQFYYISYRNWRILRKVEVASITFVITSVRKHFWSKINNSFNIFSFFSILENVMEITTLTLFTPFLATTHSWPKTDTISWFEVLWRL